MELDSAGAAGLPPNNPTRPGYQYFSDVTRLLAFCQAVEGDHYLLLIGTTGRPLLVRAASASMDLVFAVVVRGIHTPPSQPIQIPGNTVRCPQGCKVSQYSARFGTDRDKD